MYGHSAHDSGATGPVAVPPACVQLRMGSLDVVVRLLQWVLAVSGAVVALWLGSVLLASPASAAVVVPMASTSGLLKGGKDSGDNGSGDGGGDSSDSGDNGDDDNGGNGDGRDTNSGGGNDNDGSGGSGEQRQQQSNGDGEQYEPKSKDKSEQRRQSNGDGEQYESKSKDKSEQRRQSNGDGKQYESKSKDKSEQRRQSNGDGEQYESKSKDKSEQRRQSNGDGEQYESKSKDKSEQQRSNGDDRQKQASVNRQHGVDSAESPGADSGVGSDDEKAGDGKASVKHVSAADVEEWRDQFATDLEGVKQELERHLGDAEGDSEGGNDEKKSTRTSSAEDDEDGEQTDGAGAEELRKTVTGIVRDAMDDYTGEDGDNTGHRASDLGQKIEKTVRDKVEDAVRNVASRVGLDSDDAKGSAERGDSSDSFARHGDDEDVDRAGDGSGERAAAAVVLAKESAQEWGEFGEQVWRKVDAVRSAARNSADVEGAVQDLVDAASDVPGAGAHEEKVGKAAAELVGKYADYAMSGMHDSGKDTANNGVLTDAQDSLADCAGSAQECASADKAQNALLLRSGRGPPPHDVDGHGRSSRHDGDHDDDDGDHDGDEPNATDDYLNDRIAANAGAKDLAEAKKDADAGKMTAAEYSAAEQAQDEREDAAVASRQRVDDEDAELVDDVVDGHAELSASQEKLDAEAKQVAAGAVSTDAHETNVTAFEQRRGEVYEQTDQLREVAGRGWPETVPDAGDGAAAGCGASGAFVECRAVTGDDREQDQYGNDRHDDDRGSQSQGDRCVALAGVSSGCGVSAGSGDSAASASCDLSGADAGCSSSSREGSGEDAVVANARFELGDGDGGASTRASSDGASMECRSSGGGCSGDTSGPSSDRDGDSGEKTVQSGGQRSGAVKASATCETTAGGCEGSSRVRVDEQASADASSRCDSGATGCAGAAATSANGEQAETPAAAAASKASSRATTAAADCAITTGGCSAHAGADAGNGDEGVSQATVQVDGSGRGATATSSTADGVVTTRDGSGKADCTVTAGSCGASSDTRADNPTTTQAARYTWDAATRTVSRILGATVDGDGVAVSAVDAWVDCNTATCTGSSNTATTGKITATAPAAPAAAGAAPAAPVTAVRETKADANCATIGGSCRSQSQSQVGDTAAATQSTRNAAPKALSTAGDATTATPAGRVLTAGSTANASVECELATCSGTGTGTTSVGASGEIVGVRDSTATTTCAAHGAGGGCAAGTTSKVTDRSATGPDAAAVDSDTGVVRRLVRSRPPAPPDRCGAPGRPPSVAGRPRPRSALGTPPLLPGRGGLRRPRSAPWRVVAARAMPPLRHPVPPTCSSSTRRHVSPSRASRCPVRQRLRRRARAWCVRPVRAALARCGRARWRGTARWPMVRRARRRAVRPARVLPAAARSGRHRAPRAVPVLHWHLPVVRSR